MDSFKKAILYEIIEDLLLFWSYHFFYFLYNAIALQVPQNLLLMMGTEMFKIYASWEEKLTKMRVSFLMNPSV